MESNPCYHITLHLMKFSWIYLDWYYLLLWCYIYIFDVCSYMLTCLIYILIVFFKQSKLQKYDWLELLRYYYHQQKTIPTVTKPAMILPIFPLHPPLHYIPFNYFLPLFIPSIDWIVWCKRYGCLLVSTHIVVIARKTHAF